MTLPKRTCTLCGSTEPGRYHRDAEGSIVYRCWSMACMIAGQDAGYTPMTLFEIDKLERSSSGVTQPVDRTNEPVSFLDYKRSKGMRA